MRLAIGLALASPLAGLGCAGGGEGPSDDDRPGDRAQDSGVPPVEADCEVVAVAPRAVSWQGTETAVISLACADTSGLTEASVRLGAATLRPPGKAPIDVAVAQSAPLTPQVETDTDAKVFFRPAAQVGTGRRPLTVRVGGRDLDAGELGLHLDAPEIAAGLVVAEPPAPLPWARPVDLAVPVGDDLLVVTVAPDGLTTGRIRANAVDSLAMASLPAGVEGGVRAAARFDDGLILALQTASEPFLAVVTEGAALRAERVDVDAALLAALGLSDVRVGALWVEEREDADGNPFRVDALVLSGTNAASFPALARIDHDAVTGAWSSRWTVPLAAPALGVAGPVARGDQVPAGVLAFSEDGGGLFAEAFDPDAGTPLGTTPWPGVEDVREVAVFAADQDLDGADELALAALDRAGAVHTAGWDLASPSLQAGSAPAMQQSLPVGARTSLAWRGAVGGDLALLLREGPAPPPGRTPTPGAVISTLATWSGEEPQQAPARVSLLSSRGEIVLTGGTGDLQGGFAVLTGPSVATGPGAPMSGVDAGGSPTRVTLLTAGGWELWSTGGETFATPPDGAPLASPLPIEPGRVAGVHAAGGTLYLAGQLADGAGVVAVAASGEVGEARLTDVLDDQPVRVAALLGGPAEGGALRLLVEQPDDGTLGFVGLDLEALPSSGARVVSAPAVPWEVGAAPGAAWWSPLTKLARLSASGSEADDMVAVLPYEGAEACPVATWLLRGDDLAVAVSGAEVLATSDDPACTDLLVPIAAGRRASGGVVLLDAPSVSGRTWREVLRGPDGVVVSEPVAGVDHLGVTYADLDAEGDDDLFVALPIAAGPKGAVGSAASGLVLRAEDGALPRIDDLAGLLGAFEASAPEGFGAKGPQSIDLLDLRKQGVVVGGTAGVAPIAPPRSLSPVRLYSWGLVRD